LMNVGRLPACLPACLSVDMRGLGHTTWMLCDGRVMNDDAAARAVVGIGQTDPPPSFTSFYHRRMANCGVLVHQHAGRLPSSFCHLLTLPYTSTVSSCYPVIVSMPGSGGGAAVTEIADGSLSIPTPDLFFLVKSSQHRRV
jgi:hypothetical protein